MEELDKLKNDWKKREDNFPIFSENDIYRMLHKKSSSIVKWILIVSILEFTFFMILSLLLSDNKNATSMEAYMPPYLNTIIGITSYGIILYFIFLFYNNYKKITATDNTKKLMQSILHTRKTVSYYIITNISFLIGYSIIIFIIFFNNDPEWLKTLHDSEKLGKGTLAYIFYFVGAFIGISVFAFFFWLFYRLIYGFLLKRLHRNYTELKKIDF